MSGRRRRVIDSSTPILLAVLLSLSGCASQMVGPEPQETYEEPEFPEGDDSGDVISGEGIAEEEIAAEATGGETETSAPDPAAGAEGIDVANIGYDEYLSLRGVKLVEDRGQTGVFVKLSRVPDEVRHFVLENPDRIVVDFFGPIQNGAGEIRREPRTSSWVDRVRFGRNSDRLRLVLDTKGEVPGYTVDNLSAMTVLFLGERTTVAGEQTEEILYAAGQPEGAMPAGTMEERPVAAPGGPVPVDHVLVAPSETAEGPATTGEGGYTGRRISLDFKDADVLNVLRILAEVGDFNIVASDDVKGRVTLKLDDVPWDQALDLVLKLNRLDKEQEGNVIRISTVRRLKEEREEKILAEEARRELEPLRTGYVSVNYVKLTPSADDPLRKMIENVFAGDPRSRVFIDTRTNTIVVRAIQSAIDEVRELVERLDTQTPQILIESHIVEVSDSLRRDLGIQWGYALGVGPQFGTGTGKEFPATIGLSGTGLRQGGVPATGPGANLGGAGSGANAGPGILGGSAISPLPFIADFPAQAPGFFDPNTGLGSGSAIDLALGSIDGSRSLNARLTALEEEGDIKVVSRPKVVTLNNIPALIKSVEIIRTRLPGTGTVVATGGGTAGGASAATEEIPVGITLNVTPQVSADGYILLEIQVESSTFGSTVVDGIPSEISREAFSNVLIKDGETVVLGGVYRSNEQSGESGIPFLRDIPVFGWLFKSMFVDDERQELLVFITPRLVEGGATIRAPKAEDLWEKRRR